MSGMYHHLRFRGYAYPYQHWCIAQISNPALVRYSGSPLVQMHRLSFHRFNEDPMLLADHEWEAIADQQNKI